MNNINLYDWLANEVIAEDPVESPPQPPGNPPPATDPNIAGQAPPEVTPEPQQQQTNEPEDLEQDPASPDMPEEQPSEDADFEQWKDLYFKEAVKGDTEKLLDMIHQVRDQDLQEYPRKFVEDNLQIIFLRQHANIDKASKEIRKLIKEELDQNNPSVSLVNHMANVLEGMPELTNCFIKMTGLLGMKSDLHRKFIASLLGAVQVGSGANNEDIVYSEKDFSIRISTRFNAKWGRVDIGKWALKEDDPERYLTEPELKRLEEGSPEEKDVLRRRIVMESIADAFKQRAFIFHVVGVDGTVHMLGWDLSNSLRSAYTEGKLVVKTVQSENSEAMITDDGQIVPLVDLKIKYMQETGEVDEEGKPALEEHMFMSREDGMLFLTASLQTLKEFSTSSAGVSMKETPYTGNSSDIIVLSRCHPSSQEILMRSC